MVIFQAPSIYFYEFIDVVFKQGFDLYNRNTFNIVDKFLQIAQEYDAYFLRELYRDVLAVVIEGGYVRFAEFIIVKLEGLDLNVKHETEEKLFIEYLSSKNIIEMAQMLIRHGVSIQPLLSSPYEDKRSIGILIRDLVA